jgi:hypothetical protein
VRLIEALFFDETLRSFRMRGIIGTVELPAN